MAKEFAFIHETAKGQILITKEFEPETEDFNVSIWFPLKGASGKAQVRIEDEEQAEEIFQNLKNFEAMRENLNLILNHKFL